MAAALKLSKRPGISRRMRQVNDKKRIQQFIDEVAQAVRGPGSIFLVGGTSAVWFGWRDSTTDIDIDCSPEPAGFFTAIEGIKRRLHMNIELSSPSHFVPALANWQGRNEYICSAGSVDFYHFDFYTQAYAKISRGHRRDLLDVEKMMTTKKVIASKLGELVHQRADQIENYPNLNREMLLKKVDDWVKSHV